jgi:hypothetical protein
MKMLWQKLKNDEHHPYHFAYLFLIKLLDIKANETEKLISKIAQNIKSIKIELAREKIMQTV